LKPVQGDSPVSASIVTKIHLREENSVELMVAWLNEILYWCEQNNFVSAATRIDALEEGELWATLSGEPFDQKRHHVERQVKAITYYQACLEETSGAWASPRAGLQCRNTARNRRPFHGNARHSLGVWFPDRWGRGL
jgi:hypothetical protein